MKFLRLSGSEAREYADDLARLRLQVFYDFPYLYEGSSEYEKKYLETYFRAKDSFIFLVKDGNQIIGATTGIRASEEEESFSLPLKQCGLNPEHVFYFGESVLLKEFRGKGFGKVFFQERENFAKKIGSISSLAFCAVVRSEGHPLRPADYKPLDKFWQSQGFQPFENLTTTYEWKDRGEEASTPKKMQFWLKNLGD